MSYEDEDDEYWDEYYPEHRSKNINAPAGVHIMNKNESKMLRKLMSETGLTEVELRKEKKYRKMLSDAQKEQGNKNRFFRRAERMLKSVTKELKLPNEHPLVIEEFGKRLSDSRLSPSWISYFPSNPKWLIKSIESNKKSKKLKKVSK
jgi:hypothetical protein